MADPNFELEYRLNDSDNNLLRKLLNNLRRAITGVAPIFVSTVASATTTPASLTESSRVVASAGTPEALGSGTFREVIIYPLRTNTGTVFWGTTSANDSQHGTLPVVISAPDGEAINIASIFIDVSVNNEGVRYIGIN